MLYMGIDNHQIVLLKGKLHSPGHKPPGAAGDVKKLGKVVRMGIAVPVPLVFRIGDIQKSGIQRSGLLGIRQEPVKKWGVLGGNVAAVLRRTG